MDKNGQKWTKMSMTPPIAPSPEQMGCPTEKSKF